jgi:hypothetical protein
MPHLRNGRQVGCQAITAASTNLRQRQPAADAPSWPLLRFSEVAKRQRARRARLGDVPAAHETAGQKSAIGLAACRDPPVIAVGIEHSEVAQSPGPSSDLLGDGPTLSEDMSDCPQPVHQPTPSTTSVQLLQ